ncbi:neprilysin-11-like [Centruroides sculpturatus]|uniref:neprilysin-11-like n=1 Tax=Centruroides sculpturatus TaxID=218467 RepID=UPI000C6E7C0D|nr:neprilysin-11-like [Centruroides sculpturatus]
MIYEEDRPKYINFAKVGFLYGREVDRGFGDLGILRDKYGNLKDLWTEKSKDEVKKRSQCFIDQYSSYHYYKLNITLDGEETLSDNIADNGGIRQAYLGYQKWVKDNGKEKSLPGLQKYSHKQLFFISFAQSLCSNGQHLLEKIKAFEGTKSTTFQSRVIGSLSNMKEFSEVFNCKPGSEMNPENKCVLW